MSTTSRVLWWIAGGLATLALTLGVIIYTSVTTRISAVEQLAQSNQNRIIALESQMTAQGTDVQRRLSIIETKLDELNKNLRLPPMREYRMP